jgi:hypothetical protein
MNEGQRLILNDGTVIEDGSAGLADGFLWLYAGGYTMTAAAEIFLNPAKTAKIIFQYGGMEDAYTGYTVCKAMIIDGDGNMSVRMAKG